MAEFWTIPKKSDGSCCDKCGSPSDRCGCGCGDCDCSGMVRGTYGYISNSGGNSSWMNVTTVSPASGCKLTNVDATFKICIKSFTFEPGQTEATLQFRLGTPADPNCASQTLTITSASPTCYTVTLNMDGQGSYCACWFAVGTSCILSFRASSGISTIEVDVVACANYSEDCSGCSCSTPSCGSNSQRFTGSASTAGTLIGYLSKPRNKKLKSYTISGYICVAGSNLGPFNNALYINEVDCISTSTPSSGSGNCRTVSDSFSFGSGGSICEDYSFPFSIYGEWNCGSVSYDICINPTYEDCGCPTCDCSGSDLPSILSPSSGYRISSVTGCIDASVASSFSGACNADLVIGPCDVFIDAYTQAGVADVVSLSGTDSNGVLCLNTYNFTSSGGDCNQSLSLLFNPTCGVLLDYCAKGSWSQVKCNCPCPDFTSGQTATFNGTLLYPSDSSNLYTISFNGTQLDANSFSGTATITMYNNAPFTRPANLARACAPDNSVYWIMTTQGAVPAFTVYSKNPPFGETQPYWRDWIGNNSYYQNPTVSRNDCGGYSMNAPITNPNGWYGGSITISVS